MGRKKDVQIIQLENKVNFIEGNLKALLANQEIIVKKHNESMIQMRDLLTKLIEGR